MWKWIALAAVAVIAVGIALIAFQPGSFTVERSAEIDAAPEAVVPHVASLRAMDEWSLFAGTDPDLGIVYEGPETGVGARSIWEGPQAGRGRLTITGAEPGRVVEMLLEMQEPVAAENRIRFTLTRDAGATRVTWRMQGERGFVGKVANLVYDPDEMIGAQFERGLASLKARAEGAAAN